MAEPSAEEIEAARQKARVFAGLLERHLFIDGGNAHVTVSGVRTIAALIAQTNDAARAAQEAEIARLKHYIARMEEARANKPDYEVLWAEQVDRAEKAEALWEDRLRALADYVTARIARAEKAEALWEDRLRALAEARADLAILLHAHDNGNAVPPLMMREIRARHRQRQGDGNA